MKLRNGVDLIETHRIAAALDRQGDAFLKRIYTAAEQQLCGGNTQSLAARFAAKEAVSKALGTGIGAVAFTEIEILRAPSGEPLLQLHGAAAQLALQLGITYWSISLSHTHEHAIAMVVALVE